jgi:Rrf2 family protein
MLSSSRFMVAVHALSVIARRDDGSPVCSSIVAESVNTNPVVIRRLMRDLERASLVASVTGRAGGFKLGRQAGRITLADIYKAVEDESIFRMHKTDPKGKCPVGAAITKVVAEPLRLAEQALERALATTTLDDIASRIT